jgi:hypothetical protein
MFLRRLFDPESSTLTYLIADDASHETILIDPDCPSCVALRSAPERGGGE